jgi:hypothetical protein
LNLILNVGIISAFVSQSSAVIVCVAVIFHHLQQTVVAFKLRHKNT